MGRYEDIADRAARISDEMAAQISAFKPVHEPASNPDPRLGSRRKGLRHRPHLRKDADELRRD